MDTIGFFGLEGSYSYFAARQYFVERGEYFGKPSLRDIFEGVANRDVQYGVIPFKNAVAGVVVGVQDLLSTYPVRIVGEVDMPIPHSLLGLPGAKLENIRRVHGHHQSFLQCSMFFASHPEIEQVLSVDNASAAKFVVESKDMTSAVTASEEAAKIFGLDVLATGLANSPDNMTTFIVIELNK